MGAYWFFVNECDSHGLIILNGKNATKYVFKLANFVVDFYLGWIFSSICLQLRSSFLFLEFWVVDQSWFVLVELEILTEMGMR